MKLHKMCSVFAPGEVPKLRFLTPKSLTVLILKIEQVYFTTRFMGLDKDGYQVNSYLISGRKHMLWYSLEAPRRGASNEYPQHMFSSRNKKNIDTFWLQKSALSRAMLPYLSISLTTGVILVLCKYSRLSLSRLRLSRITTYREAKI